MALQLYIDSLLGENNIYSCIGHNQEARDNMFSPMPSK